MLAPPEPDEYVVQGLHDPVEILIDRWGVPHIYAKSDGDLYVAQGFNAARDRLFQIDLWRRRGLGLLSEVLGAAYLEQDRANRLFLYRGDMAAEWQSYGSETKTVATAFVVGVNAYVNWVLADPARLPDEFRVHGYLPSLWEAEDVVRIRTHGVFMNAEAEIARAVTLRDAGERAERIRLTREPNDPYRVPDPDILDFISDGVLDLYRKAFITVGFPGSSVGTAPLNAGDGSNNWVIAPGRTTTGRPILASDPHRAITLPSLRYLVHLESPTTSLIGAGEPVVPGVSIGHNGHVAFGLTIGCTDQEDLYFYDVDPGQPGRYRYQDRWEEFRTVNEVVRALGDEPVEVALTFSRHGPVICVDTERGFAVALKAAWLEPGMAPYLGSLRYASAADVYEFREALRHWGAPGVNQVFADHAGNVGWQYAARVPRRANWDGGLPVAGHGEFEWDGYLELEDLPSEFNPDAGWFTSSNEMNLPADYDNRAKTITYDWTAPARHNRLVEWLTGAPLLGVNDCAAMQFDVLSVEGRSWAARLSEIDASTFGHQDLFEKLQNWSGDTSADSLEAILFEVWLRRHLRPWLIEAYFDPNRLESAAARSVRAIGARDEAAASDLRGDRVMFDELSNRLSAAGLADALDRTFTSAVLEVEELLGPDRGKWQWGALHQVWIDNSALAAEPTMRGSSVGPFPRGGTGDTVQLATYDNKFRMVGGSTFRMVIDVGRWDNSVAINAPGQSGNAQSTHYDDLFVPWCQGDTFPLTFSRSAVEEVVGKRLWLTPDESA